MKDSLRVGISTTEHHTVTPDLSPAHLSGVVVLSTPSMINMMELASHRLAASHLDDGETTVGTHVNVSHQAAATGGEEVTVTSTLAELRRNRLTFDVAVKVGDRVIGEGTHQRAVIDTSRFT